MKCRRNSAAFDDIPQHKYLKVAALRSPIFNRVTPTKLVFAICLPLHSVIKLAR
jgi:hypothetical protein